MACLRERPTEYTGRQGLPLSRQSILDCRETHLSKYMTRGSRFRDEGLFMLQ